MRLQTLVLIAILAAMSLPGSAADAPVQVAAYYFPNWHRKPGDPADAFGEWPNLQRAIPRFPGHQQPKKPLWGYLDESDLAVMARKIDAAADYGVSSFIFCWYYHAAGPMLDEALRQGYLKAPNQKRVPFALMWANHDAGKDRPGAILREVFDKMADSIVTDYFSQPSYWRVDGRLYFSIYEIETFIKGMGGVEKTREALDDLRRKTAAAGLGGVHINIVDWQLRDPKTAPDICRKLNADSSTSYVWIHHVPLREFPAVDYLTVRDAYFKLCDEHFSKLGIPHFPNVMVGWDPTPRLRPDQKHTGKAYPDTPVVTGNTPARFRDALAEAKTRAMRLPPTQRIVTIYAWNEWSEGGYLEPDEGHKFAYLEAIREVFGAKARSSTP